MSPHEGEDPLSLWFAIIPAIIAGVIGVYLVVKWARQWRLRKRVHAERPDPEEFAEWPELLAMLDQFYLSRWRARQKLDAREESDAAEADAILRAIDAIIEEGIAALEELRGADDPEAIIAARHEIARIDARLEACAQEPERALRRGEGEEAQS